MARRWTEEEEIFVVHATEDGLSNTEIALALDRTYHSVACKKHELKQNALAMEIDELEEFYNSVYVKNMRRLVVGFFGGCLAIAGILALVGGAQ